MKKSNRFWIFIFAGLLIIALTAAITLENLTGGNVAEIYQDGVLIESIDLLKAAEPVTFTVESDRGYNVITAEYGHIRVSDADCPDGICIRQGSLNGVRPIVCLPHGLVIRFGAEDTSGIDAVAG